MALLAVVFAVLPLASGIRDTFDDTLRGLNVEAMNSSEGPDCLQVSGSSAQSEYMGVFHKTGEMQAGLPVYKTPDQSRWIYYQDGAWCIGTIYWYLVEVVALVVENPDPVIAACHVGIKSENSPEGTPASRPDAVKSWSDLRYGRRAGKQRWQRNPSIRVQARRAPEVHSEVHSNRKHSVAQHPSEGMAAWTGVLKKGVLGEGMAAWTAVLKKGVLKYKRENPESLRTLLLQGMPPEIRLQVWKAALGLPDGQLPDEVLRRYRSEQTPDQKSMEAIMKDVPRSFPRRETFRAEEPRLTQVLSAFAVNYPDIGFAQGMGQVAGFLLIVSGDAEEAFALLERLSIGLSVAGFWRNKFPLLTKYLTAVDRLLADKLPALHKHLQEQSVATFGYEIWFARVMTLFVTSFPLITVKLIWDVVVFEGLPMLLKITVSMLQAMERSLLDMDRDHIFAVFKNMMDTYSGTDGELNAFIFGQLLVRNAFQVTIPDDVRSALN